MGHTYDTGRVVAARAWAGRAAARSGAAELSEGDIERILLAAGRASECIARPAGPVAMLLAGRLLREGAAGDPAEAVARALHLLGVEA